MTEKLNIEPAGSNLFLKMKKTYNQIWLETTNHYSNEREASPSFPPHTFFIRNYLSFLKK